MRLPLLLALALLMAGCAAPAASNDLATAADAAPVDAPAPETTSVKVSLPAAAPVGEPRDTQKGKFTVPEGATHVVVEARWTCASPTCGFAVVLFVDGKAEDGAEGKGAARFAGKAPAAGDHEVALMSTGPAFGMSGEVRATAFYAEPPAGWSAFEEK